MDDSYIDIYCERTGAEMWAEPLNALTNLAFVIAAYFAYSYWKAKGEGEKDILLLTIILAIIGIGSFLFHTFAQPWSLLADVLPIAIFIHLAIFSAAHRVFGLHNFTALLIMIAFAAFTYYWELLAPAEMLNGSVTYLPAFFALLAMSLLARANNLQAARSFCAAAILLVISLTFRSLDMQLCNLTAGVGTHFMWHCLNGLLMFKVIQAMLLGRVAR